MGFDMSITVDLSGTDNLPSAYGLSRVAPKLGARIDAMSGAYAQAQTTWRSLTEHYQAPEQHLVHAALDKPRMDSQETADAVAASVAALEAFAEAVEIIKKKRADLKADIEAARQADAEEDKEREENNLLGEILDFGEDWLITRRLQGRADALAEELHAAEDECIRAHSRLTRTTVDVVSAYGENKDAYIAQDASQAFNRVQNSLGDPAAAMQQYLSLLATLTPAQMALFLKHNPGAPLSVPPLGSDPRQNKDFWEKLSPEKRKELAQALPSLVGNLEGIPYSDRIPANSDALGRVLAQPGLSESQKEPYREIKRALDVTSGGATRGIISFDPAYPPLAAIAIGNMDRAKNVTWNVPGMGTTAESMEEWSTASQNIYDAQKKAGATDHAVVAWVGYHTPGMIPDSWDVMDSTLADAGGDRLASSLNGFNTASAGRDPYISVAAHSYGTTTTAYGLTRIDFDVDSVAFFGSAGVDPAVVDEVSDLRIKDAPDGQPALFATNASKDIVAPGGALGSGRLNPIDSYNPGSYNPFAPDTGFGAHVFSSDGDPQRDLAATLGHSVNGESKNAGNPAETLDGHGYLDLHTQSLDSVAQITTGHGDDVMDREQELLDNEAEAEDELKMKKLREAYSRTLGAQWAG